MECPHCKAKLEIDIILSEKKDIEVLPGMEAAVNKKFTLKEQEVMFEKIWVRYPRRERKKDAWNAFKRSVCYPNNWDDIKTALARYKDIVRKRQADPDKIMQGGTFFNGWEDWVKDPTAKNEFSLI